MIQAICTLMILAICTLMMYVMLEIAMTIFPGPGVYLHLHLFAHSPAVSPLRTEIFLQSQQRQSFGETCEPSVAV